MGELAEDFAYMKEQRKAERAKTEPKRVDYAIEQLQEAGHTVRKVDDQQLKVNGNINFWPFTGWFAGKGVGSGRGINTLLKKLK